MAPTDDSSEKPYQLTFERRPDYLYIRIETGRLELEYARDLVREVAEELKKSDHSKILAELHIGGRLSAADRFLVVSEFPQLGLARFKFALLYPSADNPDEYGFAETVLANRGMRAKAFTSLEEAERWLMGE